MERRDYTIKNGPRKSRKKAKHGEGAKRDTSQMTYFELVTHYALMIFDIPYMDHHRLRHLWTLYFFLFVDMLIVSISLASDKAVTSIPYFEMAMEAKYNNFFPVILRSLHFGPYGYIVGRDEECNFPPARYNYDDLAACSAPPLMRTCKGFHLDSSESALFSEACSVCGPSLSSAYWYTVAHASFVLLTWNFVSRRTDKRKDSPFSKQMSVLVSGLAVYCGIECQKLTLKCGSALSSVLIPSFSSHTVAYSTGYCVEVMGFSVTLSSIVLIVTLTTRSIPLKERKSAKAEALSFKNLKQGGTEFFSNVKTNTDSLSKKGAEKYKNHKLSTSRASGRNSGAYEHTEVKAFTFD